uniref:TSPY n=1 Tax=Prolemur simus TaxID=1328070 RepID=A0A8C8YE62_PROSS
MTEECVVLSVEGLEECVALAEIADTEAVGAGAEAEEEEDKFDEEQHQAYVEKEREEEVQGKKEEDEEEEKQDEAYVEKERVEGLQEKVEDENNQTEAGSWPRMSQTTVEALEALQLDLEPVNRRVLQRRQAHLEHRMSIIQDIPGFWAKFVNHPQILILISDQKEDMLSYMINLKVEELKHPNSCCRIMLFFQNNPYFWNKVFTKEYLVNMIEYRASHPTPIQWYQEYECEAHSCQHQNCSLKFFNWFSDHNFTDSYKMAEVGPSWGISYMGFREKNCN